MLTKCVRVSSTATTRAVIEALADKFLPDLKMLTDNRYTLWEVGPFLSCILLLPLGTRERDRKAAGRRREAPSGAAELAPGR